MDNGTLDSYYKLEKALQIGIDALETIKRYGNDGICPYGCDTPNIAHIALEKLRNTLNH